MELSVDGREGRLLGPGEGVRVGTAQFGWEVPCISRPSRKKRNLSDEQGGVLASVSEEFVREACEAGIEDTEEEPGGGWVEDLNGLLGFNKGFRGRYVSHNEGEE